MGAIIDTMLEEAPVSRTAVRLIVVVVFNLANMEV